MNKARCLFSPLLFSYCNKTRKGNKKDPHWKGKKKAIPICRWHDHLCRQSQENLQNKQTNKNPPKTNESSKLYLDILAVNKKIQYWGKTLTNMYRTCMRKTTRMLMKNQEETKENGQIVLKEWIGVKMSVLPQTEKQAYWNSSGNARKTF